MLLSKPTSEQTIKRSILFIISLAVLIIILLLVLYKVTAPNITTTEVNAYVQGIIQSMSINKADNSKIRSVEEAVNSPMAGRVWCVSIEPAMKTSELVAVHHILVTYMGSLWSGLLFEDSETKQAEWLASGCKSW
jgi:hypothetical protein